MLKYLEIFYRPGDLILELTLDTKTRNFALRVAYLFFMVQSFPFVLNYNLFGIDSVPLEVLMGGLIGMGIFYLFSLAIKVFSKWFRAEVDLVEIQSALGIGLLPWTVLFIILYVLISLAPSIAPLLFLVGLVYGFTILLIALNKVLRIGFLKTYVIFFISVAAVFFPLLMVFRFILSS
tara:strand:- start:1066 stop:1599 length:534 start_codon:yes stop_codon:yes gene_type:complete